MAPATVLRFDETQHGALKLVSRTGGATVRVDLGALLVFSTWGPVGEDGKLVAHVLLFGYGSLGNAMGFDVRPKQRPHPLEPRSGGPVQEMSGWRRRGLSR